MPLLLGGRVDREGQVRADQGSTDRTGKGRAEEGRAEECIGLGPHERGGKVGNSKGRQAHFPQVRAF